MYLDPASGNFEDEGLETAVAIVGMSARFAQARGLDAYWSLLNEGREAYSLYSDGSIEAQMPEGMMRFASIDELRSHLDQRP
jgi:hypothetical protein